MYPHVSAALLSPLLTVEVAAVEQDTADTADTADIAEAKIEAIAAERDAAIAERDACAAEVSELKEGKASMQKEMQALEGRVATGEVPIPLSPLMLTPHIDPILTECWKRACRPIADGGDTYLAPL